jgi:hypothetical protein
MRFCPRCGSEYEDVATTCGVCHVALRPAPPPADQSTAGEPAPSPDLKLVKIRTFSGPTARLDAELAKNLLRAEGIPCVLPGEISAETIPVFDIPLLVCEEDADRAAGILKSYLDSPGPMLVP